MNGHNPSLLGRLISRRLILMIDVALLTDKGIVFCRLPLETLEEFRELAIEAKPNEVVYAELETVDGVTYEVRCQDVLLKIVQGR